MSQPVELITIENVTKKFNGKVVLDNFSAVVRTGQITGLIGKSGAGKSVLLHMLRGNPEYQPDSGRVIYHVNCCVKCRHLGLPYEGTACKVCNGDTERIDVDFWALKEYDAMREAIKDRVAIMLQRTFALWGDKTCIENVLEAVERLKKIGIKRIVMLTARTAPEDIVRGLDSGADDYVTKPFDRKVLLARVKAVLRRGLPVTEGVDFDGLRIDEPSRVATLRGKALDLTPGEFALLVRLVAHRGRVFVRPPDERTVDVQVAKLRQKLGKWADHIETVRGVGYRIGI